MGGAGGGLGGGGGGDVLTKPLSITSAVHIPAIVRPQQTTVIHSQPFTFTDDRQSMLPPPETNKNRDRPTTASYYTILKPQSFLPERLRNLSSSRDTVFFPHFVIVPLKKNDNFICHQQ